ncbi:MAG: MarR family transcriptional regulator [Ktedonobacteraceae bacterium]
MAWSQVRRQGVASTFNLAHEREMSATQFTILSWMERNQASCTISWLANQMGLDPATIVRSVDLLEKRGLVRRRRATHDRRQVFVEFTEEGQAIQQELQSQTTARLSRLFRSMSEDGRMALLRGLHEFLALGQQEEEGREPPAR